jgi:hypothetical protein
LSHVTPKKRGSRRGFVALQALTKNPSIVFRCTFALRISQFALFSLTCFGAYVCMYPFVSKIPMFWGVF